MANESQLGEFGSSRLTYTTPGGVSVPLRCDWCGGEATGRICVGPNRHAGYCDNHEGSARRFLASVTPSKQRSSLLNDTGWESEQPDLIVTIAGREPITIRDHRRLGQKALRGLLPSPPRKQKRTGAQKRLQDKQWDIADLRRYREEHEALGEKIESETKRMARERAYPVPAIAAAKDVTRQRIYQLVAAG